MPATRITTRRAMRTATKAQLREEIAELRSIGRQMATICFNVTQGRRLTAG